MSKDRSANERLLCDQKIMVMEEAMADVQTIKREIEEVYDQLEEDRRKWHFVLQEQKEQTLGNVNMQQELDERSKALSCLIEQGSEEMRWQLSKTITNIEDQRTNLQEERNRLPWD